MNQENPLDRIESLEEKLSDLEERRREIEQKLIAEREARKELEARTEAIARRTTDV